MIETFKYRNKWHIIHEQYSGHLTVPLLANFCDPTERKPHIMFSLCAHDAVCETDWSLERETEFWSENYIDWSWSENYIEWEQAILSVYHDDENQSRKTTAGDSTKIHDTSEYYICSNVSDTVWFDRHDICHLDAGDLVWDVLGQLWIAAQCVRQKKASSHPTPSCRHISRFNTNLFNICLALNARASFSYLLVCFGCVLFVFMSESGEEWVSVPAQHDASDLLMYAIISWLDEKGLRLHSYMTKRHAFC